MFINFSTILLQTNSNYDLCKWLPYCNSCLLTGEANKFDSGRVNNSYLTCCQALLIKLSLYRSTKLEKSIAGQKSADWRHYENIIC